MEPPSYRHISVINESGRRIRVTPLKRAASVAVGLHGHRESVVCLLLTDDVGIRKLNLTFRSVDEATDVLSFPAGDFVGAPLGDIAISVEYAERQALERGVKLQQELAFLTIHGALHLVGFDDQVDRARAEMVSEMNRVAVLAGYEPDLEWSSILHKTSGSMSSTRGDV